jgi:hypothetical protein
MLRFQKIRNHNAVRIAIPVLKMKDDLSVYRVASVRKTDLRTKAHGFAGQLLGDELQAGLDNPARVFGRTVWAVGKGKLSDFSLVV